MAVTLVTSETYGESPGTVVDETTNINLIGTDAVSGSSSTGSPIYIPNEGSTYSYERWVRAKFTGTFATVDNVKFWKSDGELGTGYTINAASRSTGAYATPVNTASEIADSAVPTTEGTALTANADAFEEEDDYSQYIVLQAVIASTAAADSATSATYTWQWDETA